MKALPKAALLAATAVLVLGRAEAADFKTVNGYPTVIAMHGEIDRGDDRKLRDILNYRASHGLRTETLMLDSSGGLVYRAAMIAYMVREKGLATDVGLTGECASACMLIFAAGVQRFAYIGSRLGVHNASLDGTSEIVGPAAAGGVTVGMAQMMASFGVPDAVIALMTITPPDSMAWLDAQALVGWVTVLPPQPQQ